MNDEPASDTSAGPASVRHPEFHHDEATERRRVAAELEKRRKTNRENFNRKRGEFLDDLLRSLDVLVYAELSTIYYMDCSFFRFALRAFFQFLFLTPKPAIIPDPPSGRPFIAGITLSNMLCILVHVWNNAPMGGEATRGYMYGGLIMEFIGQQGPTSKLHLVILDLLVLTLQIVHLSTFVLRQRVKDSLQTAPIPVPGAAAIGRQTLEDEERGIRGSAEQQRTQDIELQALDSSGEAVEAGDTAEHEALLASTAAPHRTDASIFDAFNSGQIVIADLDIYDTVREQFLAYQKAMPLSGPDAERAERNRQMRQRLVARLSQYRTRIGGAAGV